MILNKFLVILFITKAIYVFCSQNVYNHSLKGKSDFELMF